MTRPSKTSSIDGSLWMFFPGWILMGLCRGRVLMKVCCNQVLKGVFCRYILVGIFSGWIMIEVCCDLFLT